MKRIERHGVQDHQVLRIPSIENFDVDVLYEILSRVPARSIVWSCKFVCKRWLSLIQSPHFVESHRIHSQTRPPSIIIRTTATIITKDLKTEFFSLEESLFEEESRAFNATLLMTSTEEERMLVCSSGLLFCLIDSQMHSVRIYNPCTGEITASIGKRIAVEEGTGPNDYVVSLPTYGFGFHPSSKEHKIVRVWEIRRTLNGRVGAAVNVCEVLTVGEDDTWRKIDVVPPCICETPAVSLNGSIYWMKSTGVSLWEAGAKYKALVAFDIGSETFREISIPKSLLEENCWIKLLEVDGCIAIFQKDGDYEAKLWIFNGNWTQEIISMPLDWDTFDRYHSIQHIPGTDIIIIKANGTDDDEQRDIVTVYHYDTKKKKTLDKVKIVGLPAKRCSLARLINYGFFTMFDSLYPVRKNHKSHM